MTLRSSRHLQDHSVPEAPDHLESVPYESTKASVPPKAVAHSVPGSWPLQSEHETEQDAVVKNAAKQSQYGHNHRSSALNGSSPPPVPPHQLPIRGSSNRWGLTEDRQPNAANHHQRRSSDLKSGPIDVGIEREPKHQSHVDQGKLSNVDPYVRDKIQYTGTNESVHVDKKIAQPVIHETVYPEVRHIRHEHITIETHTHDIYYRILPLIEVQLLPAKHFFRTASGELVPISEEEKDHMAAEFGGFSSYTITASVTSTKPPAEAFAALKQFTARPIQPHEREIKRWVGEDGVERSSQYHFHPPVLLGARLGDDMPHALPEISEDGRTKVTRTIEE